MRRTIVALFAVLVGIATTSPGATQTPQVVVSPVVVGQSASSELTAPAARYHELRMTAGQSVRINVRSEAFQPLVSVGRLNNGVFEELAFWRSGASDARIWFVAPGDGAYAIQVASFAPFGFGTYTLDVSAHPVGPAPAVTPIALGEALSGRLAKGGARIGDRLYQVFKLTTTERLQRVEIEVTAEGFRPALDLNLVPTETLPRLGSSTANFSTPALVRYYRTFPVPGEHLLLVSAVGADDEGSFSLVARALPRPSAALPRAVVLTESAQGRLVLDETVVPSEVLGGGFRPYALYELRGRRGEKYDISVRAEGFPPRLELGGRVSGGFAVLRSSGVSRPGEVRLSHEFESNEVLLLRVSPHLDGRIGLGATPEESSFEIRAGRVTTETPPQRRAGQSFRIDVFACEGVPDADARAQRIVDMLRQRGWAPEGVTIADVRKRALSEATNRSAGYGLSDDRLRADRDEQDLAEAVIAQLARAAPPLPLQAGNSPGTASPNYLSVFVCRR